MRQVRPPEPPTDEELDTYIRIRYRLMGIDISVLPEQDSTAIMDQARLLSNGRGILRDDAEAADYQIDGQFHVSMPYPAPFVAWTEE